MYVWELIAVFVIAYLLGSIPFGVVLAKLFGLPDPRTIGSGNIGATNMLRTGRKDIALLTLLLDAGKGALAVALVYEFFPTVILADCMSTDCIERTEMLNPRYAALALLAAAIGHMYSPWLKFNGGKGVATILGAAFVFSWQVGVIFCGVFLFIFALKRIVSLASIIALAAIPCATLLLVDEISALIIAAAAAIGIYKHRSNIQRLLKGEEPKMGGKE